MNFKEKSVVRPHLDSVFRGRYQKVRKSSRGSNTNPLWVQRARVLRQTNMSKLNCTQG